MTADTLAPGLKLANRYTLRRPLGQGGMAAVWEAENEAHQRVAIKMLSAALAENPELVARFFLEARAASFIAHPGIVRVLDTGQTPWGAPFLVMEELVGLSLADLLARHGRFSPAQAVAVLAPMLDAVAAAHAAGVIHRDLKPANVFVTSSAVKLLDFGISKMLTGDARLTQTGMVFGTPAYMSPEQVRDAKDATPASDVYSVGALAFELLTGAPPFAGQNVFAVAAQVLQQEAPSLDSLRPDVPAALCRLIDRALAKDPSLRPARAHVFKEQLEALVPPDTSWLFARVRALMDTHATDTPERASTEAAGAPRPGGGAGAALSLAQLFDRLARTGRRLPPAVAARLAYDLLLDPATPTTLTPAQVLISPDGRARAVPGAGLKSQRGARLQSYVAPEAWEAHASALSLQFSLGAVLLQAVSGEAPFEALTEPELRKKLGAGVPRTTWPRVSPEFPPALGPVLERMVAADPLHRYPDAGSCAGELAMPFRASPLFSRAADELAALCRIAQQPAVVKLPPMPAPEPASSGISGVAALLVAVLALAGGIGIGVSRLREEPAPEPVVAAPPAVAADVPGGGPPRPLVEAAPAAALPPSEYAVTSDPPGAALWIDGEFRGNAPGKLVLPQGARFALRLELPGHQPATVELDADGAPHPLAVPLKSDKTLGRVRFDVSDETRIWLDGVLVAQGRVELPVEANLTHRFQLEVGGRRSEEQQVRVLTAEVKTLRPE